MIGQHLHKYDLQLCAYAVENVAQHMGMIFPPLPEEDAALLKTPAQQPTKPKPSRFRRRVENALAGQPLLLGYLQRAQDYNPGVEEVHLLLNDAELRVVTPSGFRPPFSKQKSRRTPACAAWKSALEAQWSHHRTSLPGGGL
jgi:hypothetical protein